MSDDRTKTIPPISMLPAELKELFLSMGEQGFRSEQVFSWVHGRGVTDPNQMTDLSKALREKLSSIDWTWPVQVGAVHRAADNTRKIQIALSGGGAVETVLIPEGDKLTQCVSTQVGCAVGCIFCRSGHLGLKRNLFAAEIEGQLQAAKVAYLPGEKLRNVVYMGVGEPLHNVENVLRSLSLISHPKGLDLSTRRVTVSTVGFVRGLDRLSSETDGSVALAVSLHAADDETRRKLVPKVSDSLEDIIAALRRYPLPKRRRITIEYVMVSGINDSEDHARKLVRLLSPLRVKVNLLPLNPHDKTDLLPPSDDAVERFQKILADKGLSVFLRKRRGDDINAACGQLLAVE
jgi:23S rRNA (adenine2503-C2)-methyltransferase